MTTELIRKKQELHETNDIWVMLHGDIHVLNHPGGCAFIDYAYPDDLLSFKIDIYEGSTTYYIKDDLKTIEDWENHRVGHVMSVPERMEMLNKALKTAREDLRMDLDETFDVLLSHSITT